MSGKKTNWTSNSIGLTYINTNSNKQIERTGIKRNRKEGRKKHGNQLMSGQMMRRKSSWMDGWMDG